MIRKILALIILSLMMHDKSFSQDGDFFTVQVEAQDPTIKKVTYEETADCPYPSTKILDGKTAGGFDKYIISQDPRCIIPNKTASIF